MKVRVKRAMAGPGVVYMPGDILDLPDHMARVFLNSGDVEPVREKREKAIINPDEHAT